MIKVLQSKERLAQQAVERAMKTLANTWDPDARARAKANLRRAQVWATNAARRLEAALVRE